MKALTIWQPWASLLVSGQKKYETPELGHRLPRTHSHSRRHAAGASDHRRAGR